MQNDKKGGIRQKTFDKVRAAGETKYDRGGAAAYFVPEAPHGQTGVQNILLAPTGARYDAPLMVQQQQLL